MDTQQIIGIISSGLSVLSVILVIIMRFSKSKKVKDVAASMQDALIYVGDLMELIKAAEAHTSYTGAQKLDYVLTRYIAAHGGSESEIISAVDTLVDFSKQVNTEVKNDTRGTIESNRIAR